MHHNTEVKYGLKLYIFYASYYTNGMWIHQPYNLASRSKKSIVAAFDALVKRIASIGYGNLS